MKIKKLLVVPADRIVMNNPNKLLYSGELIFYSDLPKILGKENTYVYGTYSKHLLSDGLPKNCPYPSCHNAPLPTFVDESGVDDIISSVDVVLISILATRRGDHIKKKARQYGKPIALFDFPDHETNYGSKNILKDLCHGNVLNEDYDLYFKKDLPLGYSSEFVLPIAPVPVRPESFDFKQIDKKYSLFYSGRGHGPHAHSGYQKDRRQTVELIRNNIKNVKFVCHDTNHTFMSMRQYWDSMSESRICLSPSGRVWDSFRHTETGLAPNTALVAPKPWVHTVGPELVDGVNSILYDTELIGNKYSLVNKNDLLEKINYYLENPDECSKIARKWSEDVMSGHTIYARSKYIIESIENKL